MNAKSIVELICPALYTDVNVDNYISLAREEIDQSYFGTNYEKAAALKACHLYTLNKRPGGDAGLVSSKKEGGLSISYENNIGNGMTNSNLSTTSYGSQLLQLTNNKYTGGMVNGMLSLNGS